MSEQLIEPRVRYEEQIKALPCVSKRTKIYSLSGTVREGNMARILLDNYQNGILETKDCYLNFTCSPTFKGTNIAGAAAATDVLARDPTIPIQQIPIFRNLNTAATLIQKVEVLVNGVSICVMDNYNMINQILRKKTRKQLCEQIMQLHSKLHGLRVATGLKISALKQEQEV